MSREHQTESRYRCTIRIHRSLVDIYSPVDSFVPSLSGVKDLDYRHDIPGFGIVNTNAVGQVRIVHDLAEPTGFDYDPESQSLHVRAEEKDIANGQALAYLSYWLTEANRHRDNVFSFHAAAVAAEDQGILMIGDRGAGKTSAVLGLGEKYGTKLIANDLTIASYNHQEKRIDIEEGSKKIRLRLRSVLTRFPSLLIKFKDISGPAWTTKVLVDPADLGIKVQNTPVKLSKAFNIHLSNVEDEDLVIKRAEGIGPYFELYENMSRIIRGSGLSIFGTDENILGYIPSLETAETHTNKVNFLNYLIKERGLWSISGGNLDKICEAIYQLSR